MYRLIAKIGSIAYVAALTVAAVVCIIMDADKNLVREVMIEAGSSIEIEDFFKTCPNDARFVSDISVIDTNVPAVYQLTVRYDEVFVEDVTLRIEDHTAPKGIALPHDQYASLEWPDASECVGYLYDLSGIAKIEYRDGTPTYQFTGDYLVPVVVTDWYDNSTVIDVPFHVTDDHNAPLFYGIHDIYVADSEDAQIDYFEGVTYVDDYDEAPRVVVDSSKVVLGQEGTYEITYKAMDEARNIRSQTAYVHVVKQRATNGTSGAGGGWDTSHHNEIYKTARALAKKLKGPVGDNLIGVHIRLRTRTRLENNQRELFVELTSDNLVSSLNNQIGLVLRKLAQLGISQSGALLEGAESLNHWARPHECLAADGEILDRALCLCAPVAVCGDFNVTHGICFNAYFTHKPKAIAYGCLIQRFTKIAQSS